MRTQARFTALSIPHIPIPDRLSNASDEERIKFLLRAAALYCCGNLGEFAGRLGVTQTTLSALHRNVGGIPPQMCLTIERLCGRELFPRELLNPAVYPIR